MSATWTTENSEAACAEGWDVFDSDGSENGPWQVQRREESDAFEDDMAVWELIRNSDVPHHQAAMAFVAEHNPQEHEAITKWVRGPIDTAESHG